MTFERRTDVALDGDGAERPRWSSVSPAAALAPSVPVVIPPPAVLRAWKGTCIAPLCPVCGQQEKSCVFALQTFFCAVRCYCWSVEMIPFDCGKVWHRQFCGRLTEWCCVGQEAGLRRDGAFANLALSLRQLCTWIWNDWFGWKVHFHWTIYLVKSVCGKGLRSLLGLLV